MSREGHNVGRMNVAISIHAVGMKDNSVAYRAYGTYWPLFILFYQAIVPKGPALLMFQK